MIVTRAPLRIPLGGGGTDFPSYYLKYGGFILSFALNKYVHVVLHDTIDKKIRLKYSKTECVDCLDDLENKVAAEALRYYGIKEGIEVATFSDVPESSGLGGSSAFCVALITALRYRLGLPLDKYEIWESSYEVERNMAGQPGGMQDQFFATYGGCWCLELDGSNPISRPIDLTGLLPRLKLVYTGTGRMNLKIACTQTEKTVGGNQDMIENLHVVKNMGIVIEHLIREGRYDDFGEILNDHWTTKKARDGSVSNPVVDKLYDLAREKGALGGKLLGLGGGGYLLLYVPFPLDGLDCIDIGTDQEGAKVVYSNG